ncbi:hypothetical protein KY290_036407 [Solanum tuberosum]|uniref:Uncharacterized protein n=1 Tax=Solanum tuberosum TaxID=4113 RepID=A0ABQ7TU79_SOLTU|nr:hypothetical protein KY289_035927 [Solanum tuberosum]KAH0639127.1 hypothetical protein KY285_035713 [Solanum tuberosum]KAH0737702.1 hypothetical protein KY290_036407 [Solanum tuberosum]
MVEHKGEIKGGRREQVWHPRKLPVKDHNVQTHNMYEALGENKEKEEGKISVIKEVEEGNISEEERRVADQYE